MYWRARSLSGVPTGREPMVPASICTCARALSREKRGACRLQALRAGKRRRIAAARCIPDSLADFRLKAEATDRLDKNPEIWKSGNLVIRLPDSYVSAERFEVIVVAA